MNFFILSDIHGSAFYLKQALQAFEESEADKLIILGDVLYHGPRNPLPEGYAPADVVALLKPYGDKIIAVRGNCDSEVDQMVLNFELMGDYHLLVLGKKTVFLTHGHLYHETEMPRLNASEVFICGHFHIPMAKVVDGVHYLNPGSLSLPKEQSPHTYAILNEMGFTVYDLCSHEVVLDQRF